MTASIVTALALIVFIAAMLFAGWYAADHLRVSLASIVSALTR